MYLTIKTSPTSFIQLLSAYYVPDTLLDAEDTENELELYTAPALDKITVE